MNGRPADGSRRTAADSAEETALKGALAYLDPLPRFEVSQPGNVLRIFDAVAAFRPEVGIPKP